MTKCHNLTQRNGRGMASKSPEKSNSIHLARLGIGKAAQPCRAAGYFGATHGSSAAHQGTARPWKALGALIIWKGKGIALQGALGARQGGLGPPEPSGYTQR